MRLLDGVTYRTELFLLCFVNHILQVNTLHRNVGRNLDNIHAIDLTELLFLCKRGTGHTCLFLIFIKQVLECDRCQRFTFPLNLHMFLRLDCLMQPVRITASRHDTSGKLIYDQDLVILHHIVLILKHQIVRSQSQDNIVLDLQIFRIRKIFYMEELLYLLDTVFCQVDAFFLFIDDKISGFLDLLAHDSIHLAEFPAGFPPLQLPCQYIAGLIESGGFPTLAGNNKRCSGLVDKNRVHLVDNRIFHAPLHQLFLIDHHVISQVIESQLVISHIGNITVVRLAPFITVHAVQHHAYLQAQEFMDLSHPLRVTLCQIIIDRNDLYAFPGQRV